jgi:ferritin-like metal-binding protein YciE
VERVVQSGGPVPNSSAEKEIDNMASTLRDAFIDEVRDLYHAEKQLVKALPKLVKGATNSNLKMALENHLGETQQQVSRLEDVFGLLGEPVRAKTCAGMAGIIEEGADALGEDFEGAVMDAAIIASAQRAEHYEIAAYGTAAAWADSLGLSDVSALLNETLAEEKAADQKLSALAEQGINEAATAGEDEDEGEDEDDEEAEDEDEPAAPGKSMKMTMKTKTPSKTNGKR